MGFIPDSNQSGSGFTPDVQVPTSPSPPTNTSSDLGFLGNIFNRPGAAIRSAIQGTGYTYGAANPNEIPKFQDLAIASKNKQLDKTFVSQLPEGPQTLARFLAGVIPSVQGYAADTATNPADVLTALVTGTQTGRNVSGINALAESKAGQAVGQFLNKERQVPNKLSDFLPQSVKNATVNEVPFLKNVRSAFLEAKRTASDNFGSALNDLTQANPDKTVSLRSVIEELKQEVGLEPKLNSAINRTPLLKNLLDNPQGADSISLKDSQDIINQIQSKVPTTKLRGFNVRPDDYALIDAINNIKGAQLEPFPEMAGVRADYGQVANDYGLIKNKIKTGSLSNNLKTGFGDVEIQDAVKRLLSDNPETLKAMQGYRNISRAKKAIIPTGVGLTALDYLRRKFNLF